MTTTSETLFELGYGSDQQKAEHRYFKARQLNDAATNFANKVVEFDQNEKVGAAWVVLTQLPDSHTPEAKTILGWTKTSNESPTAEGATSPDEC